MFTAPSRPIFRWLMAALLLLQWNAAGVSLRSIDSEARSAAAKAGAADLTSRLPRSAERAALPNETLKSALREFRSGNLDAVLAEGPALLPVARDATQLALIIEDALPAPRRSFDSRAPPTRA